MKINTMSKVVPAVLAMAISGVAIAEYQVEAGLAAGTGKWHVKDSGVGDVDYDTLDFAGRVYLDKVATNGQVPRDEAAFVGRQSFGELSITDVDFDGTSADIKATSALLDFRVPEQPVRIIGGLVNIESGNAEADGFVIGGSYYVAENSLATVKAISADDDFDYDAFVVTYRQFVPGGERPVAYTVEVTSADAGAGTDQLMISGDATFYTKPEVALGVGATLVDEDMGGLESRVLILTGHGRYWLNDNLALTGELNIGFGEYDDGVDDVNFYPTDIAVGVVGRF